MPKQAADEAHICTGGAQGNDLRLVSLYKPSASTVKEVPNPKLATWKEDLALHAAKLEEAKQVACASPQARVVFLHAKVG